MKMDCPICKKVAKWEGNLSRPFCSERCKQIDLGHWFEGAYTFSTDEVSEEAKTENHD